MAQARPGQGELARIEHRDALDGVDPRHLAVRPPARQQRGRPALGRDDAHVVAEGGEGPHLLVHEDPGGPIHGARVHVAEHQDPHLGPSGAASSRERRHSTSAPMLRPKTIHIGAKWIAVEGPMLPRIQPISASAPASER